MHKEAMGFLASQAREHNWDARRGQALDIGGYNVNGTARELFPNMQWTIIDRRPTPYHPPEINYICADARDWEPDKQYDLVICTEVLEHTAEWSCLIQTAYHALKTVSPTSINPTQYPYFANFFVTCAGPGRKPHSAIDGGQLRISEYYENVRPHHLGQTLAQVGFLSSRVIFDPHACDVYAFACKR